MGDTVAGDKEREKMSKVSGDSKTEKTTKQSKVFTAQEMQELYDKITPLQKIVTLQHIYSLYMAAAQQEEKKEVSFNIIQLQRMINSNPLVNPDFDFLDISGFFSNKVATAGSASPPGSSSSHNMWREPVSPVQLIQILTESLTIKDENYKNEQVIKQVPKKMLFQLNKLIDLNFVKDRLIKLLNAYKNTTLTEIEQLESQWKLKKDEIQKIEEGKMDDSVLYEEFLKDLKKKRGDIVNKKADLSPPLEDHLKDPTTKDNFAVSKGQQEDKIDNSALQDVASKKKNVSADKEEKDVFVDASDHVESKKDENDTNVALRKETADDVVVKEETNIKKDSKEMDVDDSVDKEKQKVEETLGLAPSGTTNLDEFAQSQSNNDKVESSQENNAPTEISQDVNNAVELEADASLLNSAVESEEGEESKEPVKEAADEKLVENGEKNVPSNNSGEREELSSLPQLNDIKTNEVITGEAEEQKKVDEPEPPIHNTRSTKHKLEESVDENTLGIKKAKISKTTQELGSDDKEDVSEEQLNHKDLNDKTNPNEEKIEPVKDHQRELKDEVTKDQDESGVENEAEAEAKAKAKAEAEAEETTPQTRAKTRSMTGHSTSNMDSKKLKTFQQVSHQLITNLSSHRFSKIFLAPVNSNDEPLYYDLIKKPVDLKTIGKQIKNGSIDSLEQLELQIQTMFTNAIMYNNMSQEGVYDNIMDMMKEWEKLDEILRESINT